MYFRHCPKSPRLARLPEDVPARRCSCAVDSASVPTVRGTSDPSLAASSLLSFASLTGIPSEPAPVIPTLGLVGWAHPWGWPNQRTSTRSTTATPTPADSLASLTHPPETVRAVSSGPVRFTGPSHARFSRAPPLLLRKIHRSLLFAVSRRPALLGPGRRASGSRRLVVRAPGRTADRRDRSGGASRSPRSARPEPGRWP